MFGNYILGLIIPTPNVKKSLKNKLQTLLSQNYEFGIQTCKTWGRVQLLLLLKGSFQIGRQVSASFQPSVVKIKKKCNFII